MSSVLFDLNDYLEFYQLLHPEVLKNWPYIYISSILSWRALLNIKLVSLFWKSNWVSTFTASSTTRFTPGVGFTISSINASLFALAIPVAVSKSIWLIFDAVCKKFSFCSS